MAPEKHSAYRRAIFLTGEKSCEIGQRVDRIRVQCAMFNVKIRMDDRADMILVKRTPALKFPRRRVLISSRFFSRHHIIGESRRFISPNRIYRSTRSSSRRRAPPFVIIWRRRIARLSRRARRDCQLAGRSLALPQVSLRFICSLVCTHSFVRSIGWSIDHRR